MKKNSNNNSSSSNSSSNNNNKKILVKILGLKVLNQILMKIKKNKLAAHPVTWLL